MVADEDENRHLFLPYSSTRLPHSNIDKQKYQYYCETSSITIIMNLFNRTNARNNYVVPKASNTGKKYLLLADVNGTLCHRTNKQDISRVTPDIETRHNYIYRRPGVKSFVRWMNSNPYVDLCVSTSILEKNAIPLLEELLPEDFQNLGWLFHSEYTKTDPMGKHAWSTVRDMDKIWHSSFCAYHYDPSNTIILDNDVDKCRDHSRNLIRIPPFINEDGLQNEYVLDQLGEYLDRLGRSQPADARQYLTEYPFQYETRGGKQKGYGLSKDGKYDSLDETDDDGDSSNSENDITDQFGTLRMK